MNTLKIRRALISVSDKTGLVDFVRGLAAADVQIVSSGGTRRHLEEAGLNVGDVSDYTGWPEMMDGRVKTLHPKIHGGILCLRDQPSHMEAAAQHGILPFELVVVNLYPFEETVARPGISAEEVIEQIDIGGPTLVRAAAKNHAFVTIATAPSQYATILEQIQASGATTEQLRRELAGAAFERTASYDRAIANYFSTTGASAPGGAALSAAAQDTAEASSFPAHLELNLKQKAVLRYGENPHQAAALYAASGAESSSLAAAEPLHGKPLSYNNLLDLDAAISIARSLPSPGAAVIKHNNPCGAATGETLAIAMQRAWEGDPTSAFGSVLGINATVDVETAAYLAEPGRFVEAIIAPDFDEDAFQLLTTKPKWKANVRLIKIGFQQPDRAGHELRQISGGLLCQVRDDVPDDPSEWRVVTRAQPTDQQRRDLQLAWAICRHVKSNAIVLVRDQALVGAGAGQMSRVDSVEIAIRKAADRSRGAVLASDAFFPFDDSIHQAAAAGVVAVVEPGGSRRDEEVIAACDQHEMPMLFTGRRHFRH